MLLLPTWVHAQDSAMVRLLKGGRVPPERQGSVIEMIGKRGTSADLSYVFERALVADGFAPPVRVTALDALAEAARNRRLRPDGALDRVSTLFEGEPTDPALIRSAVRLAGHWKVEHAANALARLARDDSADASVRNAAVAALGEIGGDTGRAALERIAEETVERSLGFRIVAALASIDVASAAGRARRVLAESSDRDDLTPLFAAFLDRRGGSDVLAAALAAEPVDADAAKRGLRAMYALGRADAGLVAELSKQAKLDSETQPLSDQELAAFDAEVRDKGDPARGERIFQRADLNCMGCHAIAGSGGAIGPDLSALGSSSPPDYVIRSIMQPDESIKEQYQTLVVLTNEGQVFQGIVADKDEQRVVLKEATGSRREIPTSEIEDQRIGGSLMPRGLANLITHGELVDLVRFLSELGKPGPYAIPAPGLVRRWRAPRDLAESLRAERPDPVNLGKHTLEADASRLRTLYGTVSGDVDLNDFGPLADAPIVYLVADLDVNAAGTVNIHPDSSQGLQFWFDLQPVEPDGETLAMFLPNGRHSLIVRVDRAARPSPLVRIELRKNPGSSTAFTINGAP